MNIVIIKLKNEKLHIAIVRPPFFKIFDLILAVDRMYLEFCQSISNNNANLVPRQQVHVNYDTYTMTIAVQ